MTAIQPLWLPNVNGESMLDSAMAYHRAGLSVIPIKKDSKESLIKWAEYQYRKPTEQEIIAWFGGERGYTKNIGMVTGEISGWSVLDMDAAHNEDEKNGWDLLKENGFQIPKFNEAPIVRTPHGYHVYYEYTPDMKNQTNAWGYKNVDHTALR